MIALVLYPLITTTLFFLGSRAKITSFLWTRYPPGFARFADCPACVGVWAGLFVAAIGGYICNIDVPPLPGDSIITVLALGLASHTWTPIVASWVDNALTSLGTTVPSTDE